MNIASRRGLSYIVGAGVWSSICPLSLWPSTIDQCNSHEFSWFRVNPGELAFIAFEMGRGCLFPCEYGKTWWIIRFWSFCCVWDWPQAFLSGRTSSKEIKQIWNPYFLLFCCFKIGLRRIACNTAAAHLFAQNYLFHVSCFMSGEVTNHSNLHYGSVITMALRSPPLATWTPISRPMHQYIRTGLLKRSDFLIKCVIRNTIRCFLLHVRLKSDAVFCLFIKQSIELNNQIVICSRSFYAQQHIVLLAARPAA